MVSGFLDKISLVVFFTPSNKEDFKVWTNYINNGLGESISDFVNKNNIIRDNSAHLYAGGNVSDNADNLVTTNTDIDKKNIGIIKMIDYFTLIELISKKNGYKNGDKIDILRIEKIEKIEAPKKQTENKREKLIKDMKDIRDRLESSKIETNENERTYR